MKLLEKALPRWKRSVAAGFLPIAQNPRICAAVFAKQDCYVGFKRDNHPAFRVIMHDTNKAMQMIDRFLDDVN